MSELLDVFVAARRPTGADSLVVALFAGERRPPQPLDAESRRAVESLLRRRGWKGGEGELRSTTAPGGRAICVLGLGDRAAFGWRQLRRAVERSVAVATAAGARRLAIALPSHSVVDGEAGGGRLSRELALATYRFDRFVARKQRPALREVVLWPAPAGRSGFAAGASRGRAIAAGVAFARDLANTPPNVATPAWMASQARAAARRWRAKIRILGPAELRRRKMGGLLAVGGGSSHTPRMVRIEVGRGDRSVALVGKGVTFDTGGISIKPAGQMDEMKWDKCGAAAVLGILEAASRLELPFRLRAYLPLAENMPDGAAYRPGDIVTISNGKTVEIVNTDAEGRMILADALAWASAEKPDHLLEYSTLTGACVVALGPTGAGLFTPDDELASGLLAAAEASGERLWRLPLWGEFLDEMRGAHGDLRNSGGRWGGASTAAAFLSEFAGKTASWAHLDIAGPAYVGEGREKRGATGYGVGLTIEWLSRLGGKR